MPVGLQYFRFATLQQKSLAALIITLLTSSYLSNTRLFLHGIKDDNSET